MSTLKARFEGQNGRRLLIEVLKFQSLVEFNEELAALLAEKGELVGYEPDNCLVEQNGTDNDIYFLIEGKVSIEVNGRVVATRKQGECIGEMAAITPSMRRSATVRAGPPQHWQ